MIKMPFKLIALFLTISTFSLAQSADEVVNNHITAIGGLDHWSKLNSVYMELSSDMGGFKVPVKMWQNHMKGMRVEFEVQGMTGIQVVTDKSGWSVMPFMGQTEPEPTNEEQLKQAQSQLDLRGQLIDYAAKGSSVEYLGEDEVEGVEVYKLKLTDKDKMETDYYIDKETSYIVKSVNKMEFQGQVVENATVYSNYKEVDGLVFPFSMDGQMGKIEVVKLDLNKSIDATIFDMPAK